MNLVLPEIGETIAEEMRIGNTIRRGDDRTRLGQQRRIARIAFEQCQAARVLFAHPGERLGAVDFLEPEKRVGLGHRAIRIHKLARLTRPLCPSLSQVSTSSSCDAEARFKSWMAAL